VPVAASAVLPADKIDAAAAPSGRLAVKVLSPDILHKSDAGLVRLSVSSDDVATVGAELVAKAKAAFPAAHLEGVLAQKMESGMGEVILGYRNDREVGPIVVLGMGGVTAELRPSVSVRIAPVSTETAREMIAELPELRKFDGYRNLPLGDLDALAEAVSRFSRLALLDGTISEAEINPLLIKEKGAGVVAVDGLVVTNPADAH